MVVAKHVKEKPIRDEITALVKRGNVTLAEYNNLRCNSWEFEALVPALTIEALIATTEHAIKNVSSLTRPLVNYDEKIHSVCAPELIRRLQMTKPLTVEHCHNLLRKDCADKLQRGEVTDDILLMVAEAQVRRQPDANQMFWTGQPCGLSEEQMEVYKRSTLTPSR